MINIFTVDVEEFHNRTCYRKYLSQKIMDKDYSSSIIGTRKIMQMLEEYRATGTFFVLGEVAIDTIWELRRGGGRNSGLGWDPTSPPKL